MWRVDVILTIDNRWISQLLNLEDLATYTQKNLKVHTLQTHNFQI